MASRVEKGFDRGAFTLVPVERGQDLPVEFKIVLLREDWRKFIAATGTGETWGDLDGRFLKFPNNERPQKRFVYFHYATSILRLQRTAEISAWAKKRMDIPAGKIWATPGAYLRKSMLLVLGQVIGDVDPAQTEEALPETFEEPENQKPVEEEVKMAKEYLALENKRPDDDDEVMD